jgi:hypothetical protein
VLPPEAICPADFEGPVLREYTLVGQYSDPSGLPIAQVTWSYVSAPPGHVYTRDAVGNEITFFADVAGQYVFEFYVENEENRSDTCRTVFTATTADVLRIEMYWNPDVEEGSYEPTDLDLMLHRAPTGSYDYYNESNNCYWRNCATCTTDRCSYSLTDAQREVCCRGYLAGGAPAGWDETQPWPEPELSWTPGAAETDPRLDLDDVEGWGPENINIRRPNPGTYRIAVHYYDDGAQEGTSAGDSEVYVRILCAGTEIYQSDGVTLSVHGPVDDVEANDFWEVGDITISYSGSGVANCGWNEFGGVGCHRICTLGQAEGGGCAPATCE